MKAMDLEIGPSSYEMCLEIDKERIKHAERSLCGRVKEARIAPRSSREAKQEQDGNPEGHCTVGASQIKGAVCPAVEFERAKTSETCCTAAISKLIALKIFL